MKRLGKEWGEMKAEEKQAYKDHSNKGMKQYFLDFFIFEKFFNLDI